MTVRSHHRRKVNLRRGKHQTLVSQLKGWGPLFLQADTITIIKEWGILTLICCTIGTILGKCKLHLRDITLVFIITNHINTMLILIPCLQAIIILTTTWLTRHHTLHPNITMPTLSNRVQLQQVPQVANHQE